MLYRLKRIAAIVAVASVAACGGGDGDNYIVGGPEIVDTDSSGSGGGTTTGGDTTTNTDARIADLEIAVSSRQLASDGSDPVIISAVVKNAKNNILKDVDVEFAVDNGGTIEADEGNSTVATGVDGGATVTGGSAVKTAKLKPGYRRDNRTLLVTVTAGDQERTIEIEVTGTAIKLNGPENISVNSTGSYSVILTDSGGEPLTHQVLSVTSVLGNTITATTDQGLSTDQDGKVVFNMKANVSGVDALTVSALGATVNQSVTISGNDFSLDSKNQEVNVNTDELVSLVWGRDGVPQANKLIYLSATRGSVPDSVTTDANGKASFMMSSATAGGTVITAVDAQSGLSVAMVREFVAVVPKHLTAQSEQSNISPEGKVTLVATVRDAAYNPVKNQKVRFNITYDTVNGSLSSAAATTDSLGRASVVYTAGNASSARDGVEIRVSLLNNPEVEAGKINLTVGDRAVQIVLGHDENLEDDGIFYKQTFGVIVTDSAGNPSVGKSVDFILAPVGYYKGGMVCDPGTSPNWQALSVYCPAEDSNDNAILDIALQEDYNGNGKLDPTHTATITNKSVVTDSEGKATVEVVYLQSHALWSQLRLSAIIAVDGTEYIESHEFRLGITADDADNCAKEPVPNPVSPYGIDNQCASPD